MSPNMCEYVLQPVHGLGANCPPAMDGTRTALPSQGHDINKNQILRP